MKIIIYILLALSLISCDSDTTKIPNTSQPILKANSSMADSALIFSYKTDFRDKNIRNKSGKEIDLLYNGVAEYFGGHIISGVNFRTECMPCERVQKFMGGLLFAKRLLITPDKIKYYKTDFNISDTINNIKLFIEGSERKDAKFSFVEGKGNIKYVGISCMDADFNKVQLSFNTGDIIIDSLINASFFEYDLDSDGRMEQYLLGTRNCSQELVVLRIKDRN